MTAADWPLWDRLRRHATDAPRRPAYIEQATGFTVTYAELVNRVKTVNAPELAGELARRSDGNGEQARPLTNAITATAPSLTLLPAANRIDFVVHLLAALCADCTVLPLDPTAPPPEADRLIALAASDPKPGGAVLLTSSGTTGRPKLVRRGRDGLAAVGRVMAEAIGLVPADRVLAAVPLSHSYGLEHGLLAPLWAGCTVLLTGGLDVPPVAAAWTTATVLPAVPSMLELLLRGRVRGGGKARAVYTAGAPLPRSVAMDFVAVYGMAVGQVYGMTEIGSVTYRPPSQFCPGNVGRPVDGVSLRLGDAGELFVRSPFMLDGYVGETVDLVEGHFPTGDLATIDASGDLTLNGRTRLLIDVGGAKVNPHEVEAVLAQHPDVAAAVVLPLPLSDTVRKVRAVIVPTNVDRPPSAPALRSFVRARLAAYKVPRLIEFRDSLPRTAAGKIARQLLETQ